MNSSIDLKPTWHLTLVLKLDFLCIVRIASDLHVTLVYIRH